MLLSLFLASCSTQHNQKNNSTNKDVQSEKNGSKAANKVKEGTKKKADYKAKKKNKISSSKETNQQQNTQNNTSVTSQTQNQGPDFSLSLTDFLNRYGMSPAAYRSSQMGMSNKDALYATPDDRQTSGELQAEYMYSQGQDPYATNNSDANTSDYNSDYYNDDNDYVEYSDGTQKYVPGKNDDWYTEQYRKHHPEEFQDANQPDTTDNSDDSNANDDYYDDNENY